MLLAQLQSVVEFWFSDRVKEKWWDKDTQFDQEIKEKFLNLHRELANQNLDQYLNSAESALAVVIVLDQFSRNMFRDSAESFAYDEKALKFAKSALAQGLDQKLSDDKVAFLYMPFMHSEKPQDHEKAVQLFSSRKALENNLEFEHAHKKIIDRFGRYPHRNEILGRESTPEEIEFLKEPNSSF